MLPASSSNPLSQPVSGHAAMDRNGAIVPWSFQRRAPRVENIAFDVLFCGVCHSDLHSVGRWGQEYPLVPGHEMVGPVTEVGAAVGGTRETSEMLDFCAEHGITADVELIAQDEINKAFERLAANDVKYRFVIDMARR